MQIRYLFLIFLVVAALGVCSFAFPEGVAAVLIVIGLSALALPIFWRFTSDTDFITRIFLVGLFLRIVFGIFIYLFDLSGFFGGDANSYNFRGSLIVDYWHGLIRADSPELIRFSTTSGSGWGMNYLVAAIYFVVGKNPLAAQSLCWVVGAATGPMVYVCTHRIFRNRQVSRFSSLAITLFPSFIIWSSQLVKDGLIIFLLVLTITMVLKLQEKFSYAALALLTLSMFGILSLRFYIFYMVAIAIVGSFLIGVTNTPAAIARRSIALIVLGMALTYLGVLRTASSDIEMYGSLERIQRSRLDQARSGESGFGEDVDVSTTEGAISAIPIGFTYLMFAPFPWQVSNLRQAITLPEVFIWWAMIPVMLVGISYTLKNRLREAFPILIFSVMLTLAYSIFQGNVGTAYRQRTQIQVFLFMFIGVGWGLYKERKEDKKILARARQKRLEEAMHVRV